MVHVWEYRPTFPRHAIVYRLPHDSPSNVCVPVMARSLRRIKPEGTHKERSQMRIAQTLEWYTTAAHGDVLRWPNNEWSDRDLQVFDLKAAVALSSTCVIEAGQTGSRSNMLAIPCMHHAPSRGHRRRLHGGRQTDMNPSIPRVATLSDRCLTLLDSVLDHDS